MNIEEPVQKKVRVENNEEISISTMQLQYKLGMSNVDKESINTYDKQLGNFNSETSKDIQVEEHAKLSCPECNITYSTTSGLHAHMQSIHKGIRYDCTKCDYRANQKGNLGFHMQSVHEGIIYYCNMCNYKACQKSKLIKHKKKKHN